MKRLNDRTVVVTGGASGIGAATSRRLASEGAAVIILDHDADRAATVVGELQSGGTTASFLQVDLSNRDAIREVGAQVRSQAPVLHGLVNNAGIIRATPLEQLDDANWDSQIAINLTAPAWIVRELLPSLQAGPGSIVNISSEGAFRPRPLNAAYDASKGGVLGLTGSLAAELAPHGIRVNSIAPGWIASEMHFGTGPDADARKAALLSQEYPLTLMNRLGRPDEIAAVIAFLISDDASYITGSCLHVDGGQGLG
ncbi:SDR family NAD(P)-dependent oxidoreductase [Amnibacterium sp. CER49]|uniref:SDR family NAD(P)-dependent oxidoreductase n=1 Tax=Amnibacterium sp. CER49 TaxID=3039161 RepID=UPI0024482FCE|nr:SDR family NAD(P)-dependent oxidoreductase [Amnibacterium sp. CER49]MDH2444097.1 SDR family NAD(P)-dependent oxidoreductase [Amnibacterium sp. CER49]